MDAGRRTPSDAQGSLLRHVEHGERGIVGGYEGGEDGETEHRSQDDHPQDSRTLTEQVAHSVVPQAAPPPSAPAIKLDLSRFLHWQPRSVTVGQIQSRRMRGSRKAYDKSTIRLTTTNPTAITNVNTCTST